MENNNLLTVRELAKKLNVSTKHIYRLIDTGLPKYNIGKTFRFDIDIVMEWIKCHQNNA